MTFIPRALRKLRNGEHHHFGDWDYRKIAQGGTYFLLHDGRAHSIEEAILMHGGEAAQAKTNYTALTTTEKEDLITFLESL